MKTQVLGAALAVCLAGGLTGCSNAPAGGGSSSGGSLGISRDDALLYAADPDLDAVLVMDVQSASPLRQVKVGRMPEKLLVAPDDTVYVANRLDRSVSVLRPGEANEAARFAVGVEPVGLAISSDSKTLYVVNAASLADAETGTLMALDTATGTVKWETPVGREPRGITLLGDGRAAVSLFKDGDVVLVDTGSGKVVRAGTRVYEQLNRVTLGIDVAGGGFEDAPAPQPFPNFGGPSTSRPRGVEALLTSHDGSQLYAASLLSTEGILATGKPDDPLGGPGDPSSAGYGGGSCGATAVASPAILTFTAEGEPQVDDLATCGGDGSGGSGERPPTLLTSNIPNVPVQGPRAMTLDPTGTFLFVANFDSNNVAIVPTSRKGSPSGFGVDSAPKELPRTEFGVGGTVTQLVNVGAGPSGIVVTRDGTRAFVFNAFDHSVSVLEQVNGRVSNTRTVTLGQDVLPQDAVAGRKLFFSAVDSRMNNPSTGISCGTCHLEGREDGHVWNFPEGPRQTPSLSGRMLARTAPFHWNGEFNDLLAFMTHTVQRRMGGSGVTPAMERQVAAFIESMPTPDNPHRGTVPADQLARGMAVYEKAQCATCHVGETLTNNTFADVGTYVTTGPVVDQPSLLPHGGLNTPSLLGLARTAPYLHDGSAQTLKARILQGKEANRHGITSTLTDAEVDDLVAYLKSL
ncbi:MAG: c-type cytochrome [Myxococcota bacterium]